MSDPQTSTATPVVEDKRPLHQYVKEENARELREARGDLDTAEVVKPESVYDVGAGDSGRSAVDGDTGAANVEPPTTPESGVSERDPVTGQFKTKAAEPKADKYGGDPRKDKEAKVNRERALRGEAERKAADLEARLAALESGKPAATATEPVTAPATYADMVKKYQGQSDFPRLDQFSEFNDPYAAWQDAKAAFIQDKRLEERDQQARVQETQRRGNEAVASAHETGAEKFSDWAELMASDAAKVDLPPAVLREIYSDDYTNSEQESLSADLIHHVLTHPDDLEMLRTAVDPIAAARLVGKLSASLVAAPSGPAQATRPVTRAKPLIKPVNGSPAAPETSDPDPETTSQADWNRIQNAKELKARRARLGA
jgi:hypothetical protein